MAFLKRKVRSKSILVWFFSYILILILAMVLNIFVYARVERNMQQQVDLANLEILENSKLRIDNVQTELFNFTTEIAYNKTVRQVMTETEVDAAMRYQFYELRDIITRRSYMDSNVKTVYVYFPNMDYIVSENVSLGSKHYYDSHYQDTQISYEEFQDFLKSRHLGDFCRFSDQSGKSNYDEIIYAMSVYGDGNDALRICATVVVEMSPDYLLGDQASKVPNRLFSLIEKDYSVFLMDHDEVPQKFLEGQAYILEKMSETDEEGTYVQGSGNIYALYTNSEKNDWKYLYLVDKADYLKDLYRIRALMIIVTLAYLLIGGPLAYFMTRYNYKPIRKLAEHLHAESGDQSVYGKIVDDFKYIDDLATKIMQENRSHKEKHKLQDSIVHDAVLLKIMSSDNVREDEMVQLLDSVGVHFPYNNFILCTFSLESINDIFFKDSDAREDTQQRGKFVVSNVLRDIIPADDKLEFFDLKGVLSCVVNSQKENILQEIYDGMTLLHTLMLEQFNMEIMICVSNRHFYIEGLRGCYEEALECSEYAYLDNSSCVFYQDISDLYEEQYYYPIEKEVQLINCLKTGELYSGSQLIEEIFNKSLSAPKPSLRQIKWLVNDIQCSILKVMVEMKNLTVDGMQVCMEAFERANACTTVAETKAIILEICAEICRWSQQRYTDKKSSRIDAARRYIDDHYSDKDLSVMLIAKQCNVSQKYLSTMFKQQTGEGILEYLTKVRMDKAIKLLKDSNKTVVQILAEVGYTSERTFFRIFKKYTGVSPRQYQERCMEKKTGQ